MSVKSRTRISGLLLSLALLVSVAWPQTSTVRGQVSDADSKQPLAGATIIVVGTRMGAASDANGRFEITAVPNAFYTLRVSFLGYTSQQRPIRVTGGELVADFALTQTTLQEREVIVEVNRARERETPVAFTNVGKEQLEQRIHGQDAPLLLKGTAGLYAFSSDGVGNGEAKLFVRGFNQNYVQVLINGIPTNDPESNSVYWSNWGSVSGAAASVQVQRGAGSSMYGSGSFGGSFNIVTGNARPRASYGVNLSLGAPLNTMIGADVNSGLIDNKFAVSVKLDKKVGEGSRLGGRYEGYNYYFSGSWFMDEQQSLKFVLHGAPQEHGYSFSNDISYFKYFSMKANSAPWLKRSVINGLPANPNDGKANYGLLDGRRELVTDDYSTLSHNHFHKPQLELHYSNDLTENSAIRATLFFSRGRGGGSSLNSSSFANNATRFASELDADGAIKDAATAQNIYLLNAYQRDSYSLHQQGGILASYEFKPMQDLKVTAGGEFRSWTADHPGHFTNLYGKTALNAQSYGARDTNVAGSLVSFTRRTYQGDVAQENDVAIFGWDLANEPTYRSQYRNYRGETPQYTIFASANYNLLPNLILSGTLQYVYYKYDLIENMPSENAIGKRLTVAQRNALGLTSANNEGKHANGKFYMTQYASSASTTITNWYEFDLINASRSRGFIQPKFGANYNVTENLNVFGNFAHVERFTDLGVYYNQGRLNPDAKDEISNQYEIGTGWTSPELNLKVNLYTMTWDNKSQRITDASQAGQPGFDRNGNKTLLVGTAEYKGIEIEGNSNLDWILPIKGFDIRGSATFSSNTWKSVLDEAKVVRTAGGVPQRAVFNSNGNTATGVRDTVFVDELAGTHVGGPPQMMLSFGATYRYENFFIGIDANYYNNHYGLDGDTYAKVYGSWNAAKTTFSPGYDKVLPDRTVIDAQAGYRYELFGVRAQATFQILNLLEEEFFADIDNFGVIPGGLRAFRFNLGLSL